MLPKGRKKSGAIIIGGTAPLTGGAAIYGIAVQRGAQIAVDEINASLESDYFKLIYEDDAHDAEKAENAMNSLIDQGVQITLSSVTTKPGIATAAILAENHIFGLTPSASGVDVVVNNTNVFQMCFTDPDQGSASAQYIYDKQLGTKIGIIWEKIDYSAGIYDSFIAKAKELGLNIVADQSFTEDSATDFTVQIEACINAGADIVFLPIYYQEASLIFAQANAKGYKPAWFGVDGMDGILDLDGFDTELAQGVMLLTAFNADSTDAKSAAFVAKYGELYGEIPNQFAADAYDCIYAIYQACLAGGVTSDMKASEICDILVAQFTSMSFDGITGTGATWSTNGKVSKAPKGMVIQKNADGKEVYVGLD